MLTEELAREVKSVVSRDLPIMKCSLSASLLSVATSVLPHGHTKVCAASVSPELCFIVIHFTP